MKEIRKDNRNVKSVFCFAVAPEFRGKGVASMLLKKVCEDAKADGFEYVEGYPNITHINEEHDYMGTVSMYEKMGFKIDYETSQKYVMTKTLA